MFKRHWRAAHLRQNQLFLHVFAPSSPKAFLSWQLSCGSYPLLFLWVLPPAADRLSAHTTPRPLTPYHRTPPKTGIVTGKSVTKSVTFLLPCHNTRPFVLLCQKKGNCWKCWSLCQPAKAFGELGAKTCRKSWVWRTTSVFRTCCLAINNQFPLPKI